MISCISSISYGSSKSGYEILEASSVVKLMDDEIDKVSEIIDVSDRLKI